MSGNNNNNQFNTPKREQPGRRRPPGTDGTDGTGRTDPPADTPETSASTTTQRRPLPTNTTNPLSPLISGVNTPVRLVEESQITDMQSPESSLGSPGSPAPRNTRRRRGRENQEETEPPSPLLGQLDGLSNTLTSLSTSLISREGLSQEEKLSYEEQIGYLLSQIRELIQQSNLETLANQALIDNQQEAIQTLEQQVKILQDQLQERLPVIPEGQEGSDEGPDDGTEVGSDMETGDGNGPGDGPGSDSNFSSLAPNEKEEYINDCGEIFRKIARLYSIISTIEIYNNDPLDMILVCELVDELRLNLYNTFYPCNCGPLTDIIDTSITAEPMQTGEVLGGNRNIHYKYPSVPPNDVSNEGILKYLYELDGNYHSDDEEKKAVLYKISIQEAENNHDFFGKKDSAPIIRESIKEITKTCRGYLNELKNEDDDFLKSIATQHFKDEWAFSREVFRYMKNNHFDKYSKLELYKILNVDDVKAEYLKEQKPQYIVKVREESNTQSGNSSSAPSSLGNNKQATYFIMHSGTFLPCYKENVPKININNSLIECIDMQPIYRRLVPMFDYIYDNNNYIFPDGNGENYANKQNEQEVAFVYKNDNDKINPYVLSIFHLLNPAIAMDPSTTASIDMLGFSLFRGGKHKEYLKNIQKINTFLQQQSPPLSSSIITNNILLQLMMNPNILLSYKFTNCLIQTLNNCFARYFSKLRIDEIDINDDDIGFLNDLTNNYMKKIEDDTKFIKKIQPNMKKIHDEIKGKYFNTDGTEPKTYDYKKYFPILFCDAQGKCFYEESENNIYTHMKILLNNEYIEFKLNDFEISSIQEHVDKKNNDNLQKYMEEIKRETHDKYKKLFLKEEYYDNFVTLGFKSDGDGNQADILRRYYISSKPQQGQQEPVGLDKLYKTLFEHIQTYKPHIMTGDKNLISTCLMKNIPFMTNGKIGFRTENDTSKITSKDVNSMIAWSDIQEDIFRVASPDNPENNINELTSILDKLCSKVKYFKDETTPVVMTNQISKMQNIKEKIKDLLGEGVTSENYTDHVTKFIENTIVDHTSCNEYKNRLQKISNNNDNDLYEIYKMLLEIKNIDLVINRLYAGLDDILKTINCEFAFLLKFLQKIQPNALNVSLGFLGKKYKNMFKKEDNGYYEFFEKNKTHPIGHLFFKYYINVKNILLRFFKNFYDAKNIHCLINKGSYSRLISFYIQNFDTLLKDQLDDFVDMFGDNIKNTSSRSRRTPVSNASSPTNASSQLTEYPLTAELINDYKDSAKKETTMYEYIKKDNKYNDILTYITNDDDNSKLLSCIKTLDDNGNEIISNEDEVKGVLNKAYGIKNKYINGNSIEIKDAITADINDLKKLIQDFEPPAAPVASEAEEVVEMGSDDDDEEEEGDTAAAAMEAEPAEPAVEGVEMESQGSDSDHEASGKFLIDSKSNNPYYVLQDLDVDDLFESNVNIKYDIEMDYTGSLNMDDSNYLTISDDDGDGDVFPPPPGNDGQGDGSGDGNGRTPSTRELGKEREKKENAITRNMIDKGNETRKTFPYTETLPLSRPSKKQMEKAKKVYRDLRGNNEEFSETIFDNIINTTGKRPRRDTDNTRKKPRKNGGKKTIKKYNRNNSRRRR